MKKIKKVETKEKSENDKILSTIKDIVEDRKKGFVAYAERKDIIGGYSLDGSVIGHGVSKADVIDSVKQTVGLPEVGKMPETYKEFMRNILGL